MKLLGIPAEFVRDFKRNTRCSVYDRLFYRDRFEKRAKKDCFAGYGRDHTVFVSFGFSLVQQPVQLRFRVLPYTNYCINIRRTDWQRTESGQRYGGWKAAAAGRLETFLLFSRHFLFVVYAHRPYSVHITSHVMFNCSGKASMSQNF
ncbi:hypothetical protein [Paenibacillus donghaensis]|uniref:hypothetical protein n=1 Tax=Paenibacillus donghaensis TaxID=414771 RepID=UPI003CCB9FD4